MSRGDDGRGFVGLSWGSAAFRAWRIAEDGALIDEFSDTAGVATLDRAGMAAQMDGLLDAWGADLPIYASGMIGSSIGWVETPYLEAPADIAAVARALVPTTIGGARVMIVPGLRCRRSDGAPDILRGEEMETFGFALQESGASVAVLPGAHGKWIRLAGGRVAEFMTSLSGEMFDRLTGGGLLGATVQGEAVPGPAFRAGVAAGQARTSGLPSLLFGVRARTICGDLARADAASYLRGLLIGAEIADALAFHPALRATEAPLLGNGALGALYADALGSLGIAARTVDPRDACVAGFLALHRMNVAS